MSYIGEALSREMALHEMTGKQVAEQAGFSEQFISDIRKGRRIPSPDTLFAITNVFTDADTAALLWLVLTDLWGQPIVNVMREWAVKTATSSAQRQEGT